MRNLESGSCLKEIKIRLSKNFKVQENIKLLNETVDLYGIWTEEFGRTLLGKNKVIDKYECNEHCIVKSANIITEESLSDFYSYLKKCCNDLICPHIDHKTTYITGILLINGGQIQDSLIKKVKKLKYTKNYRFSFYGWSIVRLMVIDLENGRVYYNKAAKELAEKLISFVNNSV